MPDDHTVELGGEAVGTDEYNGAHALDDPKLRMVVMLSAVVVAASITIIAGYFIWQWYTTYRVVSAVDKFAADLRHMNSEDYQEESRQKRIAESKPLRDRECHVKLIERVNQNALGYGYRLSTDGRWRNTDEGRVWELELKTDNSDKWRQAKIEYNAPGECVVVDFIYRDELARWSREREEEAFYKPENEPMFVVEHKRSAPEFLRKYDTQEWAVPKEELELNMEEAGIRGTRSDLNPGSLPDAEDGVTWQSESNMPTDIPLPDCGVFGNNC